MTVLQNLTIGVDQIKQTERVIKNDNLRLYEHELTDPLNLIILFSLFEHKDVIRIELVLTFIFMLLFNDMWVLFSV